MHKGRTVFLFCTIVAFTSGAFIDTLNKCHINDGECQKDLYQNVFHYLGKNGLPELNIPPIDPFALKNVSISILNMIDLRMVDGFATGVKDCVFNNMTTNIEEEVATMDLTCDMAIKGRYKISSDSPLIKNLFGGIGVGGQGNGKLKIEKMNLKLRFDFYVAEDNIGDKYLKGKFNSVKYTHEFLGKTTFAANNIILGSAEISNFIIPFMNENSKFILQSFGKLLVDKFMDFFFVFNMKFTDSVPAKYYIIDDLTSYVKKL